MSRPFAALTNAVATVAAFSTAVRLGLLDRIDRAPATSEELARTCGANERGVRLLLAALESGGFVERLADGRFAPALAGLANCHPLIPMWEHLPEAVRTGIPLATAPVAVWGNAMDAVAAVLPKAGRVLDVVTESAPWSIAYAGRHPGCRVTVIGEPAVTHRAVTRAGLADRFDVLSGPVFEARLRSYDLIMIPHVCTLLDEAACPRLFRLLSAALAPGGVLAVIEVPWTPLHELSLYLRTPAGRVHRPESYRGWLTDSGLADLDTVEVHCDVAVTVLTARR